MKSKILKSRILIVFSIALIARLIFFFVGAEVFYGKSDFYINGDTYSFVNPLINLFEHGTFSFDVKNPKAAYSRLPGYSFLIAPVYLILGAGKSMYLTISVIQVIVDCFSALLIFKIILKRFHHLTIAFLGGLIYALYPFIIVWTPIVYAESFGVFFMLLSLYLMVNDKNSLLIGIVLAISFFIRPQLLFLIPAYFLALLIKNRTQIIKRGVLVTLGFLLIYVSWPIRNYVNHGVIEPMRDITAIRCWKQDVLNFHKYINSLQPGWEPQMTQIVTKQEVILPAKAYSIEEDIPKLNRALENSRTCSDGFAAFQHRPVIVDACTDETAKLWKELLVSQMKNNTFNYFVVVPFKSLVKCLFKVKLISNWKSPERSNLQLIFTSALLIYRSLIIMIGLLGLILLIRSKRYTTLDLTILFYFTSWYLWLSIITRYLEIRYLLPADLLLIIPASYAIHYLWRLRLVISNTSKLSS